jgi:hypothetical protein
MTSKCILLFVFVMQPRHGDLLLAYVEDPPGNHVDRPSLVTSITTKIAQNIATSTLESRHGKIRRHLSNIRLFGSVTAPPNKSGYPRSLI